MNVDEGLRIGDLQGMIARRWLPSAIVAGVVFLASIVVAGILPNQYDTYTTILIEPQTISDELVEVQMGGTVVQRPGDVTQPAGQLGDAVRRQVFRLHDHVSFGL